MIARELTRMGCAIQLLTRLPAPSPKAWSEEALARSARYFPLAGLTVGVIAAGVFAFARLALPAATLLPAILAVGVAVLLTGILAAAGAAIGLTETTSKAADNASAETLSVAGAIALAVVLAIAYYCGGYVAGRMSRFDGARQGIGAWAIGLLITLAAAVLAVIAGSEYNVVERANLPRLPVGTETLTTGGAIASIVILAGTLLFAALGGIAGARYHRKVDHAGFLS